MAAVNKLWLFEKFDFYKEIPLEVRERLDDESVLHTCYKKETVYLQGADSDYIYFCKQGRVKISKTTADGKETTLYIIQPGEIFGELALIDTNVRSQRAEAIDNDVIVCSFNKQKFMSILDESPELSRRVYKKIGERLQTVEKKLSDLVFMTSEDRIINFLKEVGEPYLKPSVDESYIKPFFTHEEIAHLTATSRQTVTTVLNDLKKKEIISFSRNKMYIRQFSKLVSNAV